jgi:hypothetical protein
LRKESVNSMLWKSEQDLTRAHQSSAAINLKWDVVSWFYVFLQPHSVNWNKCGVEGDLSKWALYTLESVLYTLESGYFDGSWNPSEMIFRSEDTLRHPFEYQLKY